MNSACLRPAQRVWSTSFSQRRLIMLALKVEPLAKARGEDFLVDVPRILPQAAATRCARHLHSKGINRPV